MMEIIHFACSNAIYNMNTSYYIFLVKCLTRRIFREEVESVGIIFRNEPHHEKTNNVVSEQV